MRMSGWVKLAAIVVALAFIGILVLLVPRSLWTTSTVLTTIALALSMAAPAYVLPNSTLSPGRGYGDAGVWLVGPAGVWSWILIVVSACGLGVALYGLPTIAFAIVIAWLAVAIVGWIVMRIGISAARSAAKVTRTGSIDQRTGWISAINACLGESSEPGVRSKLITLKERVQFAANTGVNCITEDDELSSALSSLHDSIKDPSEATKACDVINGLLSRREDILRASRSQA